MSATLRAPTKEDVEKKRKSKELANGIKRPRINGIGELQSTSKILNTPERLAIGAEYLLTKGHEKTAQTKKAIEKRKTQREEFTLVIKYSEVGLTKDDPYSEKWKDRVLRKDELVRLFSKLRYAKDFQSLHNSKKFHTVRHTNFRQ
jgi:hypothetical protein